MLGLSRPSWCNSTLLVDRKLMESPFWKKGGLKYVVLFAESTKISTDILERVWCSVV